MLYNVYRIAEKTLSLKDITARTMGAALIADVIWQVDEPYARRLFEKALAFTTIGDAHDQKLLSNLRQKVLVLIAKHDSGWAKRLIDKLDEDSNRNSNERRENNLEVARSLITTQPDAALDFAERSLQSGVSDSFIWLLKEMQKTDAAAANKLFLQSQALLKQQPAIDVDQFALLGTYIFTSPRAESNDSTNLIITRVGDVGIIDLTAERPAVPARLIRAYLETAVELLSRAIHVPDRQQTSYALGYLLLPKARKFAPDLVAPMSAAMSAIAPTVPANITQETAYANLNKFTFESVEERISRAEKIAGAESRDIAFLDIAFHAWLKGDFKTSRAATARITDFAAASRLSVLNDFGEAASWLKTKAVPLTKVETLADRLPPGIERSILFLGIANSSFRRSDPAKGREAIAQSLKASQAVNDARRPFLTLCAAVQMVDVDRAEAESLLADAVKQLNTHEDEVIAGIDWRQRVEIGSLVEKFPLYIDGVSFSFGWSFRQIIADNIEAGLSQADNLKNEQLRVRAFVELSRVIVERSRKLAQSKEPLVRVGEDGMRKSASKIVMPLYPEEDVKRGNKGVVVIEAQYNGKGIVTDAVILEAPTQSIGEAVIHAVKQWKFKPSTLKGEPISVRGKLTFYFNIDEKGQGRVENPKQFQ